LQGSGYDDNGYSMKYRWTCNGGILADNSILQPEFTAPTKDLTSYVCTLTVTDDYSGSSSDSAVIYVNSNNNSSINGYSNNYLTATKQVINLTTGNLNWTTATNASPNNILEFKTTLQANNQTLNNVAVKDAFPTGTAYLGSLSVNTNYSGDPVSGITIPTISAGQTVTITYQVQVSSDNSFSLGSTTISNSSIITSNNAGTQTTTTTITVNKSLVYGASYVSTGLTHYLFTDSFFLPLLILLAGLWFYKSGEFYIWQNKIKAKFKK
jgi:hypothetical protein